MNPQKEISIVVGNYPHTLPLKAGTIKSDIVKLNFTEFNPVRKAFAPMAQSQPFDVCEMAIATFFQALDSGKPLRLLPVSTVGFFHHGSLWYDPAKGSLAPGDLKGKRVGVRAYTQTTGLWVRGILQEQYGVPSSEVTWVTTEGSHVAGFREPSNVIRVDGNPAMAELLHSGQISAAIMGKEHGDPTLKQVVEDPDAAAALWAEKHHSVMVNHMVTVTEKLAQDHPDIVKEVYELFKQGYEQNPPDPNDPATAGIKVGIQNVWSSLQAAMEYAVEQKLINRTFDIQEIFPAVLLEEGGV